MSVKSILVVNAGSSSVKISLFLANEKLDVIARGQVSGIGTSPRLSFNKIDIGPLDQRVSQDSALQTLVERCSSHFTDNPLAVVGHRIVHGGQLFGAPVRLTEQLLAQLSTFVPLAPLHQPSNLSAVRVIAKLHPDLPQVGCFDTAFHAKRDELFRHYALPKAIRDQGVIRYGFHGLSYEWISTVLHSEHHDLAAGNVVVAHLGNGSSLCAMKNGVSVDTTMGMTTLDGLPMGTRCGSIDPGVILYLQQASGWNIDQIDNLLSRQSGLLGLSGLSSDMRELLASDEPAARFAVAYYALATAQHVARMAVSLGGLDGLVFTGGIGEHAAAVREMIVARLQWLPAFAVLIIPTDEERMIAQHCCTYVNSNC